MWALCFSIVTQAAGQIGERGLDRCGRPDQKLGKGPREAQAGVRGDRLEEMGSCSEEVLVGEESTPGQNLDSLEDAGAIIKVCLGSRLGSFI